MKYKFEITSKETGIIEVEAETPEEAKQKAQEGSGKIVWVDVETEVVKEI